MRGILIDPFNRSITEVETDGSLHEIYKLIDCNLITIVGINDNDMIFLDDEGLFVEREMQEYWAVAGANQPYAGRGLILGNSKDGDTIGTTVDLDSIKNMVTFLDKESIDPEEYLNHKIFFWEDGEWKEI